jgi:hypothetical protein
VVAGVSVGIDWFCSWFCILLAGIRHTPQKIRLKVRSLNQVSNGVKMPDLSVCLRVLFLRRVGPMSALALQYRFQEKVISPRRNEEGEESQAKAIISMRLRFSSLRFLPCFVVSFS